MSKLCLVPNGDYGSFRQIFGAGIIATLSPGAPPVPIREMTLIERFPRFRSSQVRYVLPVCLVAASTVAAFYSERILSSPFLVSFMGAVGISALFGVVPSFIAGVLATLASDFFFIPPLLELNLDHATWLAGANY